jgi:hypothetical protein
MRCEVCKKRCVPLGCSYCKKDCCSSCIQLEVHECSGLQMKCKDQIEHLKQTLPHIISKKHTFMS